MQRLVQDLARDFPKANVLIVGAPEEIPPQVETWLTELDLRLVGVTAAPSYAWMFVAQVPTEVAIIVGDPAAGEHRALADALERTWGVAAFLVPPAHPAV